MKKYTATAVLSYIAKVEVEAEDLAQAEDLAVEKLNAIKEIQHDDVTFKPTERADEYVTAEPADQVKAPNVCESCEG